MSLLHHFGAFSRYTAKLLYGWCGSPAQCSMGSRLIAFCGPQSKIKLESIVY